MGAHFDFYDCVPLPLSGGGVYKFPEFCRLQRSRLERNMHS